MLVSVSELADYMDIKFTNRQLRAAEYVLLGLQSELESYLRRTIEVVTQTETHVVGRDNTSFPASSFFYSSALDTTETTLTGQISSFVSPVTIYTRNAPIVSVASIIISGIFSGASTSLVAKTDYTVQRYGVDLYTAVPEDTVTITYTSGLAGASVNIFRLLILRAAGREMQNMHDDVVGIKELAPSNVSVSQTGFTQDELKSVKRWRHHKLAG